MFIDADPKAEREEDSDISDTSFIIERYIAALLYYSTNGHNWLSSTTSSQSSQENNGLFMMSNSSHCDWYGISCDDNNKGLISEIDMSK